MNSLVPTLPELDPDGQRLPIKLDSTSNGEFAPVGRRNHFHNYTGVLVVFPADGPAPQRTPA